MIRLKKGMAWLLSALCIFTMSQVPGITAQAAENQYIKFEQSEYEINTDTTQTIKIVPKQAGGKVSYGCPAPHADIHSDNPQVATAILDEDWQGADVNYVGVDVKTGELSGTAVLSKIGRAHV